MIDADPRVDDVQKVTHAGRTVVTPAGEHRPSEGAREGVAAGSRVLRFIEFSIDKVVDIVRKVLNPVRGRP